jgi:hypothetical protein
VVTQGLVLCCGSRSTDFYIPIHADVLAIYCKGSRISATYNDFNSRLRHCSEIVLSDNVAVAREDIHALVSGFLCSARDLLQRCQSLEA